MDIGNRAKVVANMFQYYLQATTSAADPSSIRRIDVRIQSALVSSISSAGQILVRPVVVGVDAQLVGTIVGVPLACVCQAHLHYLYG